MGDFNLDLMKYNLAATSTDCLNAVHITGCNIFIDKPTRVTSDTATCIDHVYSNLDISSIENHIILGDVSDHFGTLSKIEGITKEAEKQKLYYRKTNLSEEEWKEYGLDFLKIAKKQIPSPHLLDANSFGSDLKGVYDVINNKHMPVRERRKNPNGKSDRPWITTGLKASIAKKYELLRISKQTGLSEDYDRYKAHRNKLTSLISICRNDYYLEKSTLYGQDKARTWQLVKEIMNFKRKSSKTIKVLSDKSGKKSTCPSQIANSLNDHFGSIGKFMAQKFDNMDSSKLKDPLSYISKDVQNSIFLSLPTADEISIIYFLFVA